MGIWGKLFGAADPATGRKKTSSDARTKGAGRGRTTRATRGKQPPKSGRFGLHTKGTTGKGRGRSTASTGGMGKLRGAFGGRH